MPFGQSLYISWPLGISHQYNLDISILAMNPTKISNPKTVWMKMNNGRRIPKLFFGTGELKMMQFLILPSGTLGCEDVDCISEALQAGFRGLDTAHGYKDNIEPYDPAETAIWHCAGKVNT